MFKGNLKKYWQFHANLTVNNDIRLFGSRIVVPEAKQMETLEKIISGTSRVLEMSIYCRITTGVTKALESFIKTCMVSQKTIPQRKELLISSPLPNHPCEKLATDLFELNSSTYSVLLDYYSCFVEVQN